MDDLAAVAAADALSGPRKAFESGRTRDLGWRREQLKALIALLVEHEADVVKAVEADLGKPELEAVTSECWLPIGEAKHALKHLDRWAAPHRVPLPLSMAPGSAELRSEPRGVVLIVGAWNYPFLLTLAPLVSALAAGCTAVVKPSEAAPASAALLAELLPRRLDPDAVRVVQGGPDVSAALARSRFDLIFYTGGERAARKIMAAAAETLTPVVLELGGKSPALVHPSADLAVAARRIAWGRATNAGQVCLAPDYALVPRDLVEPFVAGVKAAWRGFYGEDAAKSPDYGRVIDARHFQRLLSLLDGQTVAAGGRSDPGRLFIEPTLVVDPDPGSPIMQEEIFGPILPVVPYDDWSDAVGFVTSKPHPLAAYVFARDGAAADFAERSITAGAIMRNDVLMQQAAQTLPFGGIGPSGMGRYHGRFGFETFSHLKPVVKRGTWPDPALRYPPYSSGKLNTLRRLL